MLLCRGLSSPLPIHAGSPGFPVTVRTLTSAHITICARRGLMDPKPFADCDSKALCIAALHWQRTESTRLRARNPH